MKKVLLLSPYPPPAGGIASWTKRLLEKGLPGGWDVKHIDTNMIGGRDPFENTKISLKDEWKRSSGIWKKEKEALKDKDISVVHTCIPCTAFGMLRELVSGFIAKRSGRKYILHCRSTLPNTVNKGWKRAIFRRLSALCDGIMVLNTKAYDFAKANSKRAYIEIIPNFVSLSEVAAPDNKVWSDKIKNVIYVGGVTPEKGCDNIIEAAKELSDIRFHLVGSVSDEIRAMEIPSNVELYGNRSKVFISEMFGKCDAFLFLSRYWGEGFSNALVEAMSAGLPCIVSDWAANADMIGEDGGIVLKENNVTELVGAIRQLYEDKDIRKAMGERNIKAAVDMYSENVVLKKYVEFYERLLKNA